MKKQRDVTFDFLKAVAIFLVIWGHSMAMGPNDVYHNINGHWIVLVNMPLFMFIVGYFSISAEKRSIKQILVNKWHALIVPTLIYGSVTFIPRFSLSKTLVFSDIAKGGGNYRLH